MIVSRRDQSAVGNATVLEKVGLEAAIFDSTGCSG